MRRLHIGAIHRPVKGVTHESPMSGVCAVFLGNNTEKERPRDCAVFFASLSRVCRHSEVRGPSVNYYVNRCIINAAPTQNHIYVLC